MAMTGNSNGIHTFTIANSFTIVTTATISEQSVTIPGLVFGRDEILRIHKKTAQGLTLSAFCSADNTAKVRIANVTAGDLTPTASDTYTLTVLRHDAALPAGACNL